MNTLLVFNQQPYDGSDIAWNALRLADKLLGSDVEVRIFLMNDSVDLARDAAKAPPGYFDLGQMLTHLPQLRHVRAVFSREFADLWQKSALHFRSTLACWAVTGRVFGAGWQGAVRGG